MHSWTGKCICKFTKALRSCKCFFQSCKQIWDLANSFAIVKIHLQTYKRICKPTKSFAVLQTHCDLVRRFTILQTNFDLVNEFAILEMNLQSWKWTCNLGNEFAILEVNLQSWKWICNLRNEFAILEMNLRSFKQICDLVIRIGGKWLKNVKWIKTGSLIKIYMLMCFKSFLGSGPKGD